jgi:hypothetical protein
MWFRVLLAIVAALVIWRIGFAMLRMFATPQPEPPPPGELRKVRMTYRCEVCGTEVQMKVAPAQDPEPPRHCMDEMTLVTPIEDL